MILFIVNLLLRQWMKMDLRDEMRQQGFYVGSYHDIVRKRQFVGQDVDRYGDDWVDFGVCLS